MSEMRDFSRRKLFTAMKWNRDAQSLEQLFALKSIITEIEQLQQQLPAVQDSSLVSDLAKLAQLKEQVSQLLAMTCLYTTLLF